MNVKDLKPGQGKVDIQLLVKSVSDVRSFNKYGKELRVANAVGSDESGEIKISLWNDDIKKVNAGDTIQITNGYVSEFNGERQLSAGKFGKIEVVSGTGSGSAAATPAAPASNGAKPAATNAPSTKTPATKKPAKKEAFDEEKEKAVEADEDSEEEMNYEEKEF